MARAKQVRQHRRDSKKSVDVAAEPRREGGKTYVATVWYEDAGHRYQKWSIMLDDQPGIVAAFNATLAAIDVEVGSIAGLEVKEVLK